MSHSEMTDGAGNETGMEYKGLPHVDDGEKGAEEATIPASVAVRQPTGDDAVDTVLDELDAVADEPLDAQIQVGGQVHRVLQGRLADLGKE
ncbi:MAG TPA: hypothetical protein VFF32_10335 [Dermatophilaceae bacterium]|nr:hypothetical protein [Dermatophilaceae bacterium]